MKYILKEEIPFTNYKVGHVYGSVMTVEMRVLRIFNIDYYQQQIKTLKENSMKIERIWAMPNAWTFTIKPIKELLKEEVTNGLWCDPFAGKNSPAQVTNDIRPEANSIYHIDALEFLQGQKSESYDGVLYDPPYSITQAKEHYNGQMIRPTSMKYWGEVKKEIARVTKKGGKVICFGWNTMGIGKTRGFQMQRILLVPHGGSKNDTLVTVEIKAK